MATQFSGSIRKSTNRLLTSATNAVAKKMDNWGNAPPNIRNRRPKQKRKPRQQRRGGYKGGSITVPVPLKGNSARSTAPVAEKARGKDVLTDIALMSSATYYLGDTTYEKGMQLYQFTLNPTSIQTFSRVPNIAENFQKYKLNRLAVQYQPQAGFAQVGEMVIVLSPDPTKELPHTWDEFVAMSGATVNSVSQQLDKVFNNNDLNHSPTEKMVTLADTDEPEDDSVLHSYGRLFIATRGNTTTNIVKCGTVAIEYGFDFKSTNVQPKKPNVTVARWPTTTTYHLSFSEATQVQGYPLIYDRPGSVVYYSTGPWLVNRDHRRSMIICLSGVNTGAWNAADLNIYTSVMGSALDDDAIALVPFFSHDVVASRGTRWFFIPASTHFFAIHVAYAAVSTITALFFRCSFLPTFAT